MADTPGPVSGITRGAKWAVTGLLILVLLVGGGNLWATYAQVSTYRQFQEHVAAQQKKQGQVVEHKICTDLDTMAALQPPGGSASANPSRAFEQAEHQAWTGLRTAIGCK